MLIDFGLFVEQSEGDERGSMARERQIFFDATGKRWRRLKIGSILFVALVVGVVLYVFLHAVKPVIVPHWMYLQNKSDKIMSDELADAIPADIPVLGDGVFLRVMQLRPAENGLAAFDVATTEQSPYLSSRQLARYVEGTYIIERYGRSNSRHMVLTFDDGPDPIYTPQILDILSAANAHSTFFPIGQNVVKYPAIANRIVREGHDISNHTFTHADLDLISLPHGEQEINQTQRIIRGVTKQNPALFRIPYGGRDTASVRDDRRAVLEAQLLGYTVASYDIDSVDWGFNKSETFDLPQLDGKDKVVLLHDGGGNRTLTIAYLEQLIQAAKAQGYEFTSLSRLYQEYASSETIQPTLADHSSVLLAKAVFAWPKQLIHSLFIITLILLFLSVIVSIVLAELQLVMHRPKRRTNNYEPLVTVVVPAYNEEKVLQQTVRSILRSYYRRIEMVIIDDGSRDGTWQVIRKLRHNKRVRGFRQPNRGKAAAVNHAIKKAHGDIIVSVDADTIFPPKTIGKLVRHFHNPRVGAVAGVVKVGNVKNWLTRWQALEYITSINIERTAQAFINAITVVPGACSAWRKQAILQAGGYSSQTLAEDCDLTLAVHKYGYDVVQDMEAVALTESPETLQALSKQRFRWLFGNLQSFWKHREIILNRHYGWLGMYAIPKSLFGIFIQLLFTPLLVIVMLFNLLSGNLIMPMFYISVSYIIMVIMAVFALGLARERFSYLRATPAFKIVYSPLRTMLLYACIIAAIGGIKMEWNKIGRTGSFLGWK